VSGKVLSVASECFGLVKTGGLADVVAALPPALAGQGWRMRVMLPAYRGLADRLAGAKPVWSDEDLFGGPARLLAGRAAGLDLLLLDAPHLYDRAGGPYGRDGTDHADNAERFAALSWVAAEIARSGTDEGWKPDILHAHDWQAGLAPAYLRYGGETQVKSLVTIHNIAFQGIAPPWKLAILRLPPGVFQPDGVEYWGNISALKAGLVTADAITTVSPTYAAELMRPEFGMGLEGVIAGRSADMYGILNGVDADLWNPETDPDITRYSSRRISGKSDNRTTLLKEFGLADRHGPLAVLVSRLTWQKGVDLLPQAIGPFLDGGGCLAVLGSGEATLEVALQDLAARYPGQVAVRIGYDEALSHRMFAGGDAVLVPSRFEPCGLTQMYGLRYGTVPVVAGTGGLADTVIDANPAALLAGAATGIVFRPVDALGLEQALRRLLRFYAEPRTWAALRRNGMKADFGWTRPAEAYASLYARLLA